MPNFSPIRDIPQTELSEWEYSVLTAMKENVELLTGQRVGGTHALMNDQLTVQQVTGVSYQQMLAEGKGSSFSGSPTYADWSDYTKLIQSVVNLAYDVSQLRSTLNTLIAQVKS